MALFMYQCIVTYLTNVNVLHSAFVVLYLLQMIEYYDRFYFF